MRKKFGIEISATICLLLFTYFGINAQDRIRGEITDEANGDALIGASILVQGTSKGTVTDFDGSFELRVDTFPVILQVSYVGYDDKVINVEAPDDNLKIKLSAGTGITLAVTEVKAQRISDKQKAAPLTVESMDILAIKETPSDNFYDGLGSLKGVD
ncbi:MAG: carboxypeptidase-like regulatory domain-containing protein, partial [Saprospiraceae bacterium]|nr:carboxypeptidase-like regulatory domain-containing protein [Saprospiraceae bacterium]